MDTANLAEQFTRHFNAGSMEGIAALLTLDATAKVIGAPMPEEVGRDRIMQISMPYMMGPQCGCPLAESTSWRGQQHIILRETSDTRALVILIAVHADEDGITRLEYHASGAASPVLAEYAAETGQVVAGE